MLRALLFDFDGVIVDTEVPTYESWREIFDEHGVELTLDDWLPVVGSGSSLGAAFDAVQELEFRVGRTLDRDEIVDRRARRKRDLCDAAVLLPGVAPLLEEAIRQSLLTAIVTRASGEWVRHHLDRVGLRHEWDVVSCAVEPTASKAELYRQTLALLRVEATEAVAFEDSPAGVSAAKEAGVRCFAVPSAVTRGASFRDSDGVCPSLADVRLDSLN